MTAESPLSFESAFLDSSRARLYTVGTLRSIFAPLNGVEDGPVVDIGSGTGFFLAAFQEHLFEPALAVRIDYDRRLLSGPPGARVCSSGSALPLQSASATCVLIHFVLSRLPRQLVRATLAEAARVLRPGGRLLVVEPCLGLTTYHSSRDGNAGRLMGLARRTKAEFQSRTRDIDENVGLVLPREVACHLPLQSVDLHIAKWYTGFPEPWDSSWAEALGSRRHDLDRRDAVSDFVDAHGRGEQVSVGTSSDRLVSEEGGLVELTTKGFERLQEMRLADLDRTLRGEADDASPSVEFIPVVSVAATKDVG